MTNQSMEEHHHGLMADQAKIEALIGSLSSMNDTVRFRARKDLIRIGKPAETALIRALHVGNHLTRWGAAKALIEIGDPQIAPVLVRVLEDDVVDIRWIASEGLISFGYIGLEPLLHALIEHPDVASLREGAHHVLHVLGEMGMSQLVAPVLAALDSVSPATSVPVAAQHAINQMRETGQS
jgi:HEAT repeat protein